MGVVIEHWNRFLSWFVSPGVIDIKKFATCGREFSDYMAAKAFVDGYWDTDEVDPNLNNEASSYRIEDSLTTHKTSIRSLTTAYKEHINALFIRQEPFSFLHQADHELFVRFRDQEGMRADVSEHHDTVPQFLFEARPPHTCQSDATPGSVLCVGSDGKWTREMTTFSAFPKTALDMLATYATKKRGPWHLTDEGLDFALGTEVFSEEL